MIFGNGVDNVELSRIADAMERTTKFVSRVLTDVEREKFENLQSTSRKIEFLAGRWAAKEAFAKAYGTGFSSSSLDFQDLEIANDELGKPYFVRHPFEKGKAHLSISHSNLEAVAFVILEN